MAVVNIMEKLVKEKVEVYLPGSGCCNCDLCLDDICCLALNKMPPRYVNSPKGKLFAQADQVLMRQNAVDLDFAVINAIERVKTDPRCKGVQT